jgi:hypothetical protein
MRIADLDLGEQNQCRSTQIRIRNTAFLGIKGYKVLNQTALLVVHCTVTTVYWFWQLGERESEVGLLKEARDEVMKEAEDTRRRLEVLTQFFNKKEAELQKQLGLQSVRCSITVIYSSKKVIKNKGGGREAEAGGPHPVLQQEGGRAPETARPPECQVQYYSNILQ